KTTEMQVREGSARQKKWLPEQILAPRRLCGGCEGRLSQPPALAAGRQGPAVSRQPLEPPFDPSPPPASRAGFSPSPSHYLLSSPHSENGGGANSVDTNSTKPQVSLCASPCPHTPSSPPRRPLPRWSGALCGRYRWPGGDLQGYATEARNGTRTEMCR